MEKNKIFQKKKKQKTKKMLTENPTLPSWSLAAPPSGSLLSCLSVPAGPIQIIPTLSTLPQGLWHISGAGTGVSSILIYQGERGKPGSPPPLLLQLGHLAFTSLRTTYKGPQMRCHLYSPISESEARGQPRAVMRWGGWEGGLVASGLHRSSAGLQDPKWARQAGEEALSLGFAF